MCAEPTSTKINISRVYVGITRQSILWDNGTSILTNVKVANYWVIVLYLMRFVICSAVFNVGLCLPCVEVRIFPFFTSDQLSQQKHHFLAHLTTPF